ncbi:MAG: hypothetical protein RLZZ412_102 [Verrucomicrobiota bacterium]|jgi:hypothetical protein
MPVITAARVRTLMPDLTGTGEDTTIEALIDVADAQIAQWCGMARPSSGAYTLGSTAYILREPDLHVAHDGMRVLLRVHNVTAWTSLHSDELRAFGSDTLVDSADYETDALMVAFDILPNKNPVTLVRRGVKATVTAGWSTLPDDLEQAVAMQARHLFTLRRSQGQSSVSEAGVSVSLRDETIPAAVAQIVAPYRIPVL